MIDRTASLILLAPLGTARGAQSFRILLTL